jgi:phage terminase large subunit GpA-like protein
MAKPTPAQAKYDATALCHERYATAIREAFYQQPFLSVTDWSAENRFLTGAEQGRYNPLRCHYQQAIQDAFNDPEVREISWQSAERVGKSTVASNVLGYVIDREPCDLLWVMPSRETMADFLKDEVEPMIRANPTEIAKGRVTGQRFCEY